jgi:hypothetical protein
LNGNKIKKKESNREFFMPDSSIRGTCQFRKGVEPGKKFIPSAVAVEGGSRKEGFVAFERPERPGHLEPALVLPAG